MIGKLNHIVSIYSYNGTPDGYGGHDVSETLVASDVWANIEKSGGNVSSEAGFSYSVGDYRITIWYRPDFDFEKTGYYVSWSVSEPVARTRKFIVNSASVDDNRRFVTINASEVK